MTDTVLYFALYSQRSECVLDGLVPAPAHRVYARVHDHAGGKTGEHRSVPAPVQSADDDWDRFHETPPIPRTRDFLSRGSQDLTDKVLRLRHVLRSSQTPPGCHSHRLP